MAETFHLTFLGTGTSVGIPVIGCGCPVCTSDDPRNRRTRSSIHVEAGNHSVLVDSGPDLREQALREQLTRVDAVLYTHAHVDHVAGFDELRAFCWHRGSPLPLHGNRETLDILRRMYPWAFSTENRYRGYVKPGPVLIDGPFTLGELHITPLPVAHGGIETHGFLFDHPGHPPVAYIPDVKELPRETRDLLRNIDILILDALRPEPHPTHLSITEALAIVEETGAAQAWLTHLSHENDHATLATGLPPHVHVAHDGLRLPAF